MATASRQPCSDYCVSTAADALCSRFGQAAFYDATGACRDMVVTHLFRVMGFVAMESPVSLSAGDLRPSTAPAYRAPLRRPPC
jgi:hypothetical protein